MRFDSLGKFAQLILCSGKERRGDHLATRDAVIFFCLALWAAPVAAGEVSLKNCAPEAERGSVFSCDVQNGTDRAIARLRYAVQMYEMGRTVPWSEGGGMIDVPGGIEPGESIRQTFPSPVIPERARGKSLGIRVIGVVAFDIDGSPIGQPALETPRELDAIKATIEGCWNKGALSDDALVQTVRLEVKIGSGGALLPETIRLLEFEDGPSPGAQQAYEAARRAIVRCGVREVIPEIRPHPVSLVFTFAPNGVAMAPGSSGQE